MMKTSSEYHYRFLIYISHSYAIPIGLPLQDEIQKRGYEIQWFADKPEGKTALKNKKNTLNSAQELISYQPHIVLVATNDVADFITGIKVQIFHGFNAQKRFSKKNKFSHFNIRGFFDLYCTQGPSTTKYFNELAVKYKHFRVIETGWSKVDGLFPEKVNIKPNKPKTILIASTFTKRLSLAYNSDIFKEIKRLISEGQHHFLMILHPKIPIEIKLKWQKLECSNFKFHDTTDLNPLFKQADLMFSDTTSAIQEFILQKKPVIAYANNAKPDYLINISKIEEIEPSFSIDDIKMKIISKKINEFIMKLHPYFDGHSSARVIDATIEFLHSNKSELNPKPFNILRKYKVRKKLSYYTLKSYNKAFSFEKNY